MLAEMLHVFYKKNMIDLSYFIQLSNNKPSFLLKVMDIFINETPKDLAELEKNYAEVNYKKVKEICHKLKSLFKSYNMKDLTALTMELESHAKKEVFTEDTIALLRKVQESYSAYRAEMIEHMIKYKT